MKWLMEQAYRVLLEDSRSMVIAPTGYGKTMATPEIYRRARRDQLSWGLIHVSPLRSLVRQVHGILARKEPLAGMQSLDADPRVKSPYFLRSLVASTVDSFLYNLYRVPVAEAVKIERGIDALGRGSGAFVSLGHYYASLYPIATSTIVFDEAHLALAEEPGKWGLGAQAVLAAITALARLEVPFLLETATMRPPMLASLGLELPGPMRVVVPSCTAEEYIRVLEEASSLLQPIPVEPDLPPMPRWETRRASTWQEVLHEALEYSREKPVLIVANTVERAIDLYAEARVRGHRAILLHGRLSREDRKKALEALREAGEGRPTAIIATQVVEAGVDVNAALLYTEAAPLEDLVQRAGRACRRGRVLEHCLSSAGRVVIVDAPPQPYNRALVEEAVRLLEETDYRVDWRSPCHGDSGESYAALLARAREPVPLGGVQVAALTRYLESDAGPDLLLGDAGFCSLYRSSLLASALIVDDGRIRDEVTASLDWLLSSQGGLCRLELRGRGNPVVAVARPDGRIIGEAPAAGLLDAAGRGNCKGVKQAINQAIAEALRDAGSQGPYKWGLLLSDYEPGIGLRGCGT